MSEKPDELALAKRSRLAARRITMIEQLKDEVDALRQEKERLRDELRQSSIDTTRAENERLREALEKIADSSMSMHHSAAHMAVRLQTMAREALRREET